MKYFGKKYFFLSKTNPSFIAMCKEGKCDPKWVCGFGAIMVVIIIVLSVVINYGGGVSNQVQMDGDGDSALIEESTGIHLLEINESGKGSKGANWTWIEIGFTILCFKFVLVISHILHYCWTKKIVKQKVAKNMVVEMARLERDPPATQGVVVPALV